jgi:hypothetical protein
MALALRKKMPGDREAFHKIAKGCRAEAAVFHVLAAPVFSRLGLRLVNNPHERIGRFGYSSALYELKSGVSLLVGLELADSNTLIMRFGRKWFFNGELAALSNSYYVFARHLGIDLPEFYEMGFQEQLIKSFRTAIADIERSWPVVLAGLNDSLIDEAERARFGAIELLAYRREMEPSGVVSVEDLRAATKS